MSRKTAMEDDHTVVDLDPNSEAGEPEEEGLGDSPQNSDDDLLAELGFAEEEEKTTETHDDEEATQVGISTPQESEEADEPREEPEEAIEEEEPRELPNPKVIEALGNMPLSIAAVLGTKSMSAVEMSHLRAGSVIDIGSDGDRLVDLVSCGKTIGKGELVLVEGRLGVRIVKYF